MAQLVEWSLPRPVVHGLNPVIDKLLHRAFLLYCQLYLKGKNKEKEARNGPFLKKQALVPVSRLFIIDVYVWEMQK